MALAATMHRVEIDLSDVDRGVYESLDLRIARHPSESAKYLLARTLAYALSYEEGIAFGHGLSHADEPAVWIHDPTGQLTTWIDVGTPSAERLHKASKAARRVVVFTHNDPELLRAAARSKAIHKADRIEVVPLAGDFLGALEGHLGRHTKWTVVHHDGQLYVTVDGATFETPIVRSMLA